jgi:UDP-N-acetylglucosamine acyltransferase
MVAPRSSQRMPTVIATQAFIDPRAEIGRDVEIGPFCVVGPYVRIGDGTRLVNNVTLMGHVTLGRHNHIFPGTVIGAEPQDISYGGSPTRVAIGDHNVIREGVTINRGSEKEDGVTQIGNHNFLMAACHVAHDCQLGDHIIIANGSLLGGHVHVQDHAALSGAVAVHHFATIGSYSFVAGMSAVGQDVPPYMLVEGIRCRPRCVNMVALKRNGFAPATVAALVEAHRLIYRSKVGLDHARELLRSAAGWGPEVEYLLDFIGTQQTGRHGRARERRRAA